MRDSIEKYNKFSRRADTHTCPMTVKSSGEPAKQLRAILISNGKETHEYEHIINNGGFFLSFRVI